MPFSFSFSFFSFYSIFIFPLPFVVLRVPLPFSFVVFFVFSSCLFSVCFHYRLLLFSLRFPAFLGGGSCYFVFSSWLYTPRAPCEPEVCAYSPCVLSSLLRSCCCFFIFSSLPSLFSISIWTSFVSSCLLPVGTMMSPRFRFLLRHA